MSKTIYKKIILVIIKLRIYANSKFVDTDSKNVLKAIKNTQKEQHQKLKIRI
jgi:hypothetical protein